MESTLTPTLATDKDRGAEKFLRLDVRASHVTACLASIVCILTVASLLGVIGTRMLNFTFLDDYYLLFYLDDDSNVPTIWSSIQLLIASCLIFVIGIDQRRKRKHFATRWLILGLIFFYLAVDETAMIHETVGLYIRRHALFEGYFRFSWVTVFGPLVIIFAVLYLKFLFHLPPKVRLLVATAGILYVGGGIGLEMIGANYVDTHSSARWDAKNNLAYIMLAQCEEFLEMAGIVVFIHALLLTIAADVGPIRLNISEGRDEAG